MHYYLLLVYNVTVTVIYSKHGGLAEQLRTLRAMTCTREERAPSWLAALPAPEHGFALHKGTT